MSSSSERVFVVTGALGAIGRALATRLARERSRRVVLVTRHGVRGEELAHAIQTTTDNQHVLHERCDLSRKSEVEALASRLSGSVAVLVNNAATAPRQREETEDGIERQFATNVLGYFWMTRALTPALAQGAPSRIVNVASYWAGDLDLEDLEFKRRTYDNDVAYRQSKQANRMLSVAFANRLKPLGIAVNACHPGDVRSKLSGELGFGGHQSPEEGADTPAWLAEDEIGQRLTGSYFQSRRETLCPFARDREAVERLYAICERY